MNDRIKELEKELNAKGELLQAKTKRCDTMEEEKLVTRKNFDDLHVMAGRMFNDLTAIKEAGGSIDTLDMNKKLRKVNAQLKDTEQNLSDSIKQCGEEANKRAKAEAELARNNNIVDILSWTVAMMNKKQGSSRMEGVPESATGLAGRQGIQQGVQQTPGLGQETVSAHGMARQRCDIVCREWTGPGCFRGASCQFAHPVGRGRALPANKDCNFWLTGYCRYSAATCSKGQHVPDKLGSRGGLGEDRTAAWCRGLTDCREATQYRQVTYCRGTSSRASIF